MKTTTTQKIKTCALFLVALGLSACGGGSGSGVTSLCSQTNLSACGGGTGTGGGTTGGGQTTATPKMTLTLVDQAGNAANLLTSSGTLTARVKVTNAAGQPVSGAVILFSIANSSLAIINPASNLSDANGMALATVTLAAPDAVGATTILASTTYTDSSSAAAVTLSGSANFQVGNVQNPPQSILLVSISPADKSILLQGNTGGGRVQTAQVTFKITDLNGLAVANQKVKFAFQQAPVDLTFASDTAVSGQDGNVTAIVNSGNTVTVVTVIVTVVDQNNNPVLNRNGLPITAVSDQITVTNTVLNPDGISIAAKVYALEGRDVVGLTTSITVALTDLQGGAITDGTAVSFTTNGGAIIGDSNSAKCSTRNGACSVLLSGQNPQPPESILHADATVEPKTATSIVGPTDIDVPRGVAVIVASMQLNGSIKKKPILVAMSGSFASYFGNFNVDFTTPQPSCDTKTITFSIADVNGNMMPVGSTFSITGALNASGVIVNPVVKNPFGGPTRGTTHQLQVTPGGQIPCNVAGTRTVIGSFNLILTTPFGAESLPQIVTATYRAN